MEHIPAWLKKIDNLPEINLNLRTFGGHRQKVPFNWHIDKESHFAFEVILIISGTQQTKFDGYESNFVEGDIILIPPGVAHENSCISKKGMDYFCMHFDVNDLEIQQQLLLYCPILLKPKNPAYKKITHILNQYTNLLDTGIFNAKERILVEVLLLELMSTLLDYAESEKELVNFSDNTTITLAKGIAETIQTNFKIYTSKKGSTDKDLLSMEKIAESLNISNSTMLKTFKKVYVYSPKQYLDQLRFNESKFLLLQPKLSVLEISEIIGYDNPAHFTRQFRKWSSMSPREYRNLYLKK